MGRWLLPFCVLVRAFASGPARRDPNLLVQLLRDLHSRAPLQGAEEGWCGVGRANPTGRCQPAHSWCSAATTSRRAADRAGPIAARTPKVRPTTTVASSPDHGNE